MTETSRPTGYLQNWKPHRKSQIMLGQVQQILDEYRDHLPLTCRQIYYRMVAHYRHPKGKKFNAALGELLTNARRACHIPFGAIRDDGIEGGGYWTPNLRTHLEGVDLEMQDYRSDLQVGQDCRLEVWCEAAGMLPQLARVADEYSVPVYSCGGFNSLTSIRQITNAACHHKENAVLHLGDYDPSGVAIFQRVAEDVSAFLSADNPRSSFEARRVAITPEQITEHGLNVDPLTTGDTRSRAWIKEGRTEKCELEAMAPDVIAETLREAIEEYVDRDVLKAVREGEHLEAMALKSLPSAISQLPALQSQIRDYPIGTLYPAPLGRRA